jgi:hypothetical protein
MAASKNRRPPPRRAANGLRNKSKPSPAIGVEQASLIDIIDELHVIRAAANAAALVFLNRAFTPNHPSHFSALEELLNSIEEKTESLYERLNAELDARRGAEKRP